MITVKGPDYPFSYRALSDMSRQKRGNRKWKVGFIKTYTWNTMEEYVKSSLIDFIEILEKDKEISVEEINLDTIIYDAHTIHSLIYDKSLSYYFENEHNDRVHVSEIMNSMMEHGDSIEVDTFLAALNKQSSMCNEMDDFFKEYDVIISASTASVAPDRGIMEKDDPSLIWSLLHLPTVSIPQFYDNNSGLPFGVQVVARKYNDYLLMSFLDYLLECGYIPEHSKEIQC